MEFRQRRDLVGSLAEEPLGGRCGRGCAQPPAGHDCRACFYASRAEVETLYTVRGFLGGLRTLVRRVRRLARRAAAVRSLGRPAVPSTSRRRSRSRRADRQRAHQRAARGAMGGPVDGSALQKEVEEAGGVPFSRDVPIAS